LERIATGITALDQILEGGFPKGATILIVGKPGSGKTIFAHQMMFYNAGVFNYPGRASGKGVEVPAGI